MSSLNEVSITKMIKANMIEATKTMMELFCNSAHVGQDTLCSNSSTDSRIYVPTFAIVIFSMHGWRDSNSQPMVLETTTLPIELHPCKRPAKILKKFIETNALLKKD